MNNNFSEYSSPITKTVFLAVGWTFGNFFDSCMELFSAFSDTHVNTALSSVVFLITGLYGIINIINAVRKEITKRKARRNESE